MRLNPEFQRQLWMGCTPQAVLWTLAFSALLMAVPTLFAGARMVTPAAFGGLWAAVAIYGAVLAARSLTQELRHNTWDWQRLSSLTPWQMAWGKWLGGTAPAWLYAACFTTAGLLAQSIAWSPRSSMTLSGVAMAWLWGAVVQVWVMNGVLLGWKQSGWGWQRGLLLSLVLLWFLPGRTLRRLWDRASGPDGAVDWWAWSLTGTQLMVVLGVGLLALGLLALWRQLSQRLDVATLPWAWPVGLVGAALLIAGLFEPDMAMVLSWVSCVALLSTAYIALYAMPDGLAQWRQVQWHTARQQWRGALQALPLWPVSWLLGMLAAGAWMLLWPVQSMRSAGETTATMVVLFGMQLLRDALLLTGFSLLAGRMRSPMAGFVVAWVVLNVLLPLLALGVFGKDVRTIAAGLQPLLGYLGSSRGAQPLWYLVAMLAHILLALAWCCWVFVRQVVRR